MLIRGDGRLIRREPSSNPRLRCLHNKNQLLCHCYNIPSVRYNFVCDLNPRSAPATEHRLLVTSRSNRNTVFSTRQAKHADLSYEFREVNAETFCAMICRAGISCTPKLSARIK